MPYKVSLEYPERVLAKSDVIFNVRRGRNITGSLRVTTGGIDWLPKNSKVGWRSYWRNFEDLSSQTGSRRKIKVYKFRRQTAEAKRFWSQYKG